MTPRFTQQILQSQSGSRPSLATFWQRTRGADTVVRKDRSPFDKLESDFARQLAEEDRVGRIGQSDRAKADSTDADAVKVDDAVSADREREGSGAVANSVNDDTSPEAQLGEVDSAIATSSSLVTDPLAQVVYKEALRTIDPVLAGSSVSAQSQFSMRTSGAVRAERLQADPDSRTDSSSLQSQRVAPSPLQAVDSDTQAAVAVNDVSSSEHLFDSNTAVTHSDALSRTSRLFTEITPSELSIHDFVDQSFGQPFDRQNALHQSSQVTEFIAQSSHPLSTARSYERQRQSDTESVYLSDAATLNLTTDVTNAASIDRQPSFNGDRHSQNPSAREDASSQANGHAQRASVVPFATYVNPTASGDSVAYAPYLPANTLQTERAIFAAMQAGSNQPGHSQEVVLRLFPAKLGSMKLRITLDQQAESKQFVRIALVVESSEAQEAMRPTLAGLQAALTKQGFTQSSIDLTVESELSETIFTQEREMTTIERLGLDDVA